MRKAVYAALAGLVALLVACGGQGGDTRKVNASVGTYNYGGSTPGTALILWVDLPSPSSPDGFSVTLKDPAGNQVLSGTPRASTQGPIFPWYLRSSIAVSGGTYTVTANPPGLPSFSRQVSVNPSDVLPQPQNIQLSMSQGNLNLSWSPVPGASSYYVEVWQLDQNNNPSSVVFSWYTTGTQVQATSSGGYSFPAGNYRAYVWASNVDFTKMRLPGQAAQLDPQFKVSRQYSSAFQVTSLGTLRLLDIPAPQGEPVDVEVFGR